MGNGRPLVDLGKFSQKRLHRQWAFRPSQGDNEAVALRHPPAKGGQALRIQANLWIAPVDLPSQRLGASRIAKNAQHMRVDELGAWGRCLRIGIP